MYKKMSLLSLGMVIIAMAMIAAGAEKKPKLDIAALDTATRGVYFPDYPYGTHGGSAICGIVERIVIGDRHWLKLTLKHRNDNGVSVDPRDIALVYADGKTFPAINVFDRVGREFPQKHKLALDQPITVYLEFSDLKITADSQLTLSLRPPKGKPIAIAVFKMSREEKYPPDQCLAGCSPAAPGLKTPSNLYLPDLKK